MRSQENVLAIAESRVIYRVDYIGAERGDSTMESLQQATDGDGQRRKRTEVSRERRHTEEVHRGQTGNRTRDSPRQALPALRSTGPPETCIGPKISTSFRKKSKKTKRKKQKQDHFPQVCLFYSNRAHSVSSGSGARPHGQRRATTDTQRCAT